jgi:hypothetical protein
MWVDINDDGIEDLLTAVTTSSKGAQLLYEPIYFPPLNRLARNTPSRRRNPNPPILEQMIGGCTSLALDHLVPMERRGLYK